MDPDLAASYRFCATVTRREARNFAYSFALLPPARRRAMSALYAFMRRTDDLADEPGELESKRAALTAWRDELDAVLVGREAGIKTAVGAAALPPSPLVGEGRGRGGAERLGACAPPTLPSNARDEDEERRAGTAPWSGWPALADIVRRYEIPARHLHEVIDGVAMDLAPRPFGSFSELYRYCYHVASAVGLCCIRIWGYRSEGGRAERLAESCGIALQLTNIIRDVAEDARAGRVYLPREDLERFGVDPASLSDPATSEPLRQLLAYEGRRAYDYYAEARPLAGLVAPVGRPVLRAIVGIYRSLLDEIAARGYDVAPRRITLPAWRKAAITARSLVC